MRTAELKTQLIDLHFAFLSLKDEIISKIFGQILFFEIKMFLGVMEKLNDAESYFAIQNYLYANEGFNCEVKSSGILFFFFLCVCVCVCVCVPTFLTVS